MNENKKMTVGIIAANNLRVSPYAFFYTDILDKAGIDYEIICPKRGCFSDEGKGKVQVVDWNENKNAFVNYASFRKNVINLVKRKKYDKLIVLTTINAVLFGSFLKRRYKGKYVVDIRDYTYENNPLYFHFEKKAVRYSLLNVISSERFKSFLPKAEYHVCFNSNVISSNVDPDFKKKEQDPIIIGYVGSIAYVEQCKRLMALVKNDPRFEFHFHGSSNNEEKLKAFASELQTDRIKFFGAYRSDEKPEIVHSVDVLFNAYGNGSPLLTCALSNKLTDAAMYKKVVLNSPETFMHEKLGCCSCAVDLATADNLDALHDWYFSLDEKKAQKVFDEIAREISATNEDTCKTVAEAMKN